MGLDCFFGHKWEYSRSQNYNGVCAKGVVYIKRKCKHCGCTQKLKEYTDVPIFGIRVKYVDVTEDEFDKN